MPTRHPSLSISMLLAVLTFLAFDLTDLDQAISNLFYDPATQTFVFEHNLLFERITHQWARAIPGLFTSAAIVALLLAGAWRLLNRRPDNRVLRLTRKTRLAAVLEWSHRHARESLYFLFAFALSATAVHYLKSHTSVYCPVETTLYGGKQQHYLWFANFSLFDKAGPGRCWPGGHASGAFSLMALYFIARRYQWQHARKVLITTLALGLVFGTTRVLQGWHYLSHTFWAGLVVWWCCALMARSVYRQIPDEQRPSALESLPTQQH